MLKQFMNKILCFSCYEEITDPVCVKCSTKHLSFWLKASNLNEKAKKAFNNQIKKVLNNETDHEMTCILCKKEPINTCFVCLISKVRTVIEENEKTNRDALEFFDQSFNYQNYLKI